jgi:GNAT superfamily N-acetyltransferase
MCEYFRKPDVASAHQFAVEPTLHGLGIGRALLSVAEDWAASQGFRKLAVDTAEPALHLIELYLKLGYKRVGYVQWPGKLYRSVVLSKAVATK